MSAGASIVGAVTHSRPPAPLTSYPAAERLDLVEDLHGHLVADPYRWLEDVTDERTTDWAAAQDELAKAQLTALPGRDRIASRLDGLMRTGSVAAPRWRGGRAFFTRRLPDQEHPVLYVREADGTERVLVDVTAMDPTGLTTLDGWAPSIEGTRLSYKVSSSGDEESRLTVIDVASGEVLDGPIDRMRFSAMTWLPGGEEMIYVRRLPPEAVPDGEELFHRRVWRHRVGADTSTDVLLHGDGLDMTLYYGTRVSEDGRWLIVDATPGTAPRQTVWLADLHGDGELRKIVDGDAEGGYCSAWFEDDNRLYLMTTLDSPRWRLCVADPEHPERANWTELIAEEADSVLEGVHRVAATADRPARLLVLRTRHAVSELHLHDDVTGEHINQVQLPGMGSVHALSTVDALTDVHADDVWLGWADFVTPPCVYRFSLATGEVELESSAPGATTAPSVHTSQLTYTSKDGTAVRMFVIAPTERPEQPLPVLLNGYGGFSNSSSPGYRAAALAWAEAGGVYAIASLRGGGEEGETWHQAGMRANKQNTFDDLHAAAEHLIAGGWTTSEQLSIMGGSNGGLLVGAALTQRPELYRAVVCSAPLLDMVRYEKFLIGRTWNDEYGSADKPEELAWLLSYSPYHHVREGVRYPSVLFSVFESDSRVDPCHARKMCAALQHSTTGSDSDRPIVFRRETEVGHSTRSVSRMVDLLTDELAFLASATGLDLESR
ncbi:prolyl oligopeptidase family serine peptidase [Allokutzneria multivorans]|uniref:prolyl oligopeptidase n=1 Tax=Allokutzneria multivorans TaxID=1142134 RepID=A0ABP7SV75_9PSEU